jgi:OOP family OmpA-OmpF porin
MIANVNGQEGLISHSKRLGMALAVAAAAMGASSAWADPEMKSAPLGVYVGLAGGFAPSHRVCEGNSSDACDRLSFGHKIFGGYNVTNDVSLEVAYLYFNGVNRDYTNAENATRSRERVSDRALTLGMDWHVQLINDVTNHIRFGLARNQRIQQNYLRTGGVQTENVYKTSTFLGAGLAYALNDFVHFEASFDYIFNNRASRHLLSLGVVGEF